MKYEWISGNNQIEIDQPLIALVQAGQPDIVSIQFVKENVRLAGEDDSINFDAIRSSFLDNPAMKPAFALVVSHHDDMGFSFIENR